MLVVTRQVALLLLAGKAGFSFKEFQCTLENGIGVSFRRVGQTGFAEVPRFTSQRFPHTDAALSSWRQARDLAVLLPCCCHQQRQCAVPQNPARLAQLTWTSKLGASVVPPTVSASSLRSKLLEQDEDGGEERTKGQDKK
eukprot:TRINITY_DN10815_c0_g1_i1.p1 TRINITY_DN10815_c0_g1~~TRINITY_DN10815_c0_g1_i1.p1  ORF type:complete len:140 (+),score=15.51 TRINITY_DN10815_c0_g1_i1:383-802(+)